MREAEEWVFYVSRSAKGVDQDDVDEIVRVSQARNREHRLTGMLLFTGAHFAQMLEGEPSRLDGLIGRILADRRHGDVRVLGRDRLARRRFRQWSLRCVTHVGRADLIEDLLDAPEVPFERVLRLTHDLFRFPPERG